MKKMKKRTVVLIDFSHAGNVSDLAVATYRRLVSCDTALHLVDGKFYWGLHYRYNRPSNALSLTDEDIDELIENQWREFEDLDAFEEFMLDVCSDWLLNGEEEDRNGLVVELRKIHEELRSETKMILYYNR